MILELCTIGPMCSEISGNIEMCLQVSYGWLADPGRIGPSWESGKGLWSVNHNKILL